MAKSTTDKIGLWTCTSLVVGNMIGSGVFLLPSTLAAYGGISIVGWLFSSLGAFILAVLFSYLSRAMPSVGGPYAYTREGLGEFAAFLVAWGYWISTWCGNAAITVAFVSYLSVFFPVLSAEPLVAVLTGLSAIWLLTWVNSRGVALAGRVQLVTTVLKLLPLLLIALFGFFYIDWQLFIPFNRSTESNLSAIGSTATLTLWAYLGMESATVPAGNVENPEKTIPRATLLGTAIAACVYIFGTVAVMGLIPVEMLKNSAAPFANTAAKIWGESARLWVAFGAMVSTFGALNGWILMQGQIPLAMTKDKLFPSVFGKENSKGVPALGIVISSILLSVLMSMNFSKTLVEQFKFMILLSTLTVLIPYLFSSASFILILKKQNIVSAKERTIKLTLAFLAFAYSLWAVAGSGQEVVYWGFILLMLGVPVFIFMKYKSKG
ncbi:MAG: amino acid permease [Saprospiraceae bacterium]|nr:amino acid permease [Saprospiraceae bacterium]